MNSPLTLVSSGEDTEHTAQVVSHRDQVAQQNAALVAEFKLDKSSALQQEQVSPEAVPIVT